MQIILRDRFHENAKKMFVLYKLARVDMRI